MPEERELALYVRRGPASGRVFPLARSGVTLIGRAASNHIVLADRLVSASHCLVVPGASSKGLVLVDARSRAGTLVNGRPVTKGAVAVGDAIAIGPFELEVIQAQAEAPSPTARPATGRSARFELVPRGRRGSGQTLLPGSATLIGRSPLADIRVNEPFVSEFHCLIALDPTDDAKPPLVIDLHSDNHTYIGRRPVHRKHLRPGHSLFVGHDGFQLCRVEAGAVEAPRPLPPVRQETPSRAAEPPESVRASPQPAELVPAPPQGAAAEEPVGTGLPEAPTPAEAPLLPAIEPEHAWPAAAPPSRMRRLWRRRRRAGATVFLAAAAAGMALAFWWVRPCYRAEAVVQVNALRRRPASPAAEQGPEVSYGAFFDTQMAMVASDDVLRRCLGLRAVAGAPFLADAADPVRTLREKLQVQRVGETQWFSISAQAESPRGLAPLVNSVAESCLARFEEGEQQARARGIERFAAQQKELKLEFEAQRAALAQLRIAIASDPDTGSILLYRDPIRTTDGALVDLRAKQGSLKSKLESLQASLNAGRFPVADALIEKALDAEPQVQQLAEMKTQLHREMLVAEAEAAEPPAARVEKQLAAQPQTAALRQEIARTELRLAELSQAPQGASPSTARNAAPVPPERIIEALPDHAEVQQLAARLKQLRDAMGREQEIRATESVRPELTQEAGRRLKQLQAQAKAVEAQVQPFRPEAANATKAVLATLRERLLQAQSQLRPKAIEDLRSDGEEKVRALRRQAESLDRQIQDVRQKARPKAIDRLKDEMRDAALRQVQELETEIAANKTSQTVLQAMLATQLQQQTVAERKAAGLKALEEDLKRTEQSLAAVEQAMRDTETASGSPGYLTIASKATEPKSPEPYLARRLAYSLGGVAAAAALALLAMLLLDVREGRIEFPDDLRLPPGTELLGAVSDWSQEAPGQRGGLALICRAGATPSLFEEEMQNLMVGVIHPAGGQAAQVLLITSPAPGDGKTTLAVTLAACIARLGRKVLLIDASPRKPDIAGIFGLGPAPGLSDLLLAAGAEPPPASVVRETDAPSLSVLPAGTSPFAAMPLLGSARMSDLLLGFRSGYDHIILDASLLTRTETHIMAPLADGVICCLRARTTRRKTLRAALAALSRLGPPTLGLVLLGMPLSRGRTLN